MKTKYSYKQIWTIAYPILISLIMEQMIGMTDTAFLGRVGEIELGASAIAGVYYLAIFMMAFGFSIGAQILIARRNGEGNYKEIGPIFYQGIYFLLVIAVVLFTLSIVFSPHILKNIISSPHIYDAAESYIHWRVYGFFFSFVMVMFRAFFVGTTQTKTLTLNSIVMVLSNVVFNYILIFGKFGFPQLGIAGAAIGSSLSEMVSVIFFIIYTWKRIDCKKYALNILPKFQGKTLKRILNVSVWTMIQNFVGLSTFTDPLRTSSFPQNWTIYYWAYWMVWCVAAPFFIGSISRGRTVRQTILGGYIFGVGSTLISFIVLGNYSMGQQITGRADFIAQYLADGDLYDMIVSIINTLPLSKFIMVLVLICMIAFYATSFDSIALTASCYSYHRLGEDEQPHKLIQLMWCILLILLPMALLFAESSMSNLQSVSIVAAFPVGAVIVMIALSFLKDGKKYMEEVKQKKE